MTTDLLILTIYFICVGYVLYQMALSLERRYEDQIEIHLESDPLQTDVTQQLTNQGKANQIKAEVVAANPKSPKSRSLVLSLLSPINNRPPTGSIALQVLPQGKKPLQPPLRTLNVQLTNRSPDMQIYIDWDRCSMTRMQGQTERVIRQIPGMPLDLLQAQVFSVVNPGQMLNAQIAPESSFNRNAETRLLEAKADLINFETIVQLPDIVPKTYTLGLLVWLKQITEDDTQAVRLLIPFNFKMEVLRDEPAFPPLKWLLSR
ncbi:MAG: hypothetical protein AAGF66_00845 [Cyanobacteria bacterium P01_H01_bin.119]